MSLWYFRLFVLFAYLWDDVYPMMELAFLFWQLLLNVNGVNDEGSVVIPQREAGISDVSPLSGLESQGFQFDPTFL